MYSRLGEEETILSQAQEKGNYNTMSGSHSNTFQEGYPLPSWTWARYDSRKRRFPQTIAHRGYKAMHPENTMKAFEAAVEVGAHALETDIHLSSDDVIVLSHDSDLKRCFGRPEKVVDCDWQMLSELRTLKAPHEPMPRLRDLLEYLGQPEQQHIWVLLDIKLDNDSDKVMRLISETLDSVASGPRQWKDRVVLGIWAAKFLPLCSKYLPGYPVSHIGFSTCYAKQFLKVENVSFNMLQKVLFGPIGARFIRDVKEHNRQLFVWTVNDVNLMKWSIQKEMDGVITDNPELFNEVCDNWDDDEPPASPSWFQWLYTFWLYILIMVFTVPFRRRFPGSVGSYLIKAKDVRAQARIRLDG